MSKNLMPRNYSNIIDELTDGVIKFYRYLNDREFTRAFSLINPELYPKDSPLQKFKSACEVLLLLHKKIKFVDLCMEVELDFPFKADYAKGYSIWRDADGENHRMDEKWIKVSDTWIRHSFDLM